MHWIEATRILVFSVPWVWILNKSQKVTYHFKPDLTWQHMSDQLHCYTKLVLNSSSSHLLSQAQAQKPEQSHTNSADQVKQLHQHLCLKKGEKNQGALWTAHKASIKIPPIPQLCGLAIWLRQWKETLLNAVKYRHFKVRNGENKKVGD